MSGDLSVECPDGFPAPGQSDGDGCETVRSRLVKRQYGDRFHKNIDEPVEFCGSYSFSTKSKFGKSDGANKYF